MMNSFSWPLPRRARGFNLIEAAIVLGVVGLVIGGIWVAAAQVAEKRLQNIMFNGLAQTVHNLRDARKQLESSPTDIQLVNGTTGTGPGVTMKAVPDELIDNNRAITPYGGYIGIDYSAATGNFQIAILGPGLTQARCLNLLTRVAYTLHLTGSVSPSGYSYNDLRSMQELKDACGETPSGTVSVLFVQVSN